MFNNKIKKIKLKGKIKKKEWVGKKTRDNKKNNILFSIEAKLLVDCLATKCRILTNFFCLGN